MSEATAKLLVQAAVAVVLIVAMTWIVVSPVDDTVSKAALMVVSTAVGFMFGKNT